MKTTFKFLFAAFALALSMGAYTTLQAQAKPSTVDKYPGPSIEVFIKVKQRGISTFNLTALVRNKVDVVNAESQLFSFTWVKDGKLIGLSQELKGVGYGHYTVYVRVVGTSNWGTANITLSPPRALARYTAEM